MAYNETIYLNEHTFSSTMGAIEDIFTGIMSGADKIVAVVTPSLNSLVAAVLILFAGLVLGKIMGKALRRLLKDLKLDETTKRVFKRQWTLERTIASTVSFLIYFAAIIMALNALGVTTILLTIIFAILLITLIISFLIAVKDLLPNVIGGMAIRQKDLFRVQDNIAFESIEGTVELLTLTETRLRRKNGDLMIVPNSVFVKTPVTRKRRDPQ